MSFLFAYGSLRPTANHAGIQHLVSRLKLVGTGRFPGRLYYLGRYPGAIFNAPGGNPASGGVLGDVLELESDTLLAEIDAYEGYDPAHPHAGEYARLKRMVEVAGVGAVECWLYELRQLPASAIAIEAGDYVSWLRERRAS